MSTYTSTITTAAPAERVLAVLTDPERIGSWSPVPFEVEGEPGPLRAGTETRVSGSLAGMRVGFDVHVHDADASGLRLTAQGPLAMDVTYGLRPMEEGSEVEARISVRRGRGLASRLVGTAAAALLAAGALDGAAGRIACAAEAEAFASA
jgi:hypothetical protein